MKEYGLQLKDAEALVSKELISSVDAEQQDDLEWTFYITFTNPHSNEIERIFIERQRLGKRTWADPRRMFDLMYESFGISEGVFKIKLKRLTNAKN
ncbi:hypothetical protein [Acinetobacter variabilis]|uniref:hypothetical protein n=1 Tax=Acinetobacter variabilis TaxID=70346 RepID=UPI0028A66C4D|nr:hypothetical protein [Acinetobacter variabilis]